MRLKLLLRHERAEVTAVGKKGLQIIYVVYFSCCHSRFWNSCALYMTSLVLLEIY